MYQPPPAARSDVPVYQPPPVTRSDVPVHQSTPAGRGVLPPSRQSPDQVGAPPRQRPDQVPQPDPVRPDGRTEPPVALERVDPATFGVTPVVRKVDDWRDDANVLFRGDSRSPEEILADGGFRPVDRSDSKGEPVPVGLRDHVHGGTNTFVSTSTRADTAIIFGSPISGYVYRIKAPEGILGDASLNRAGDTGPRYQEDEVLFAGGVDHRYVEGWHKVKLNHRGERYLGPFIPNEHYIGGRRDTAPEIPESLRRYDPDFPDPRPDEQHGDDAPRADDQRAADDHEQPEPEPEPDRDQHVPDQDAHQAVPAWDDSPVDPNSRTVRLLAGRPVEPPPPVVHAGTGDQARQREVLDRAFPGIEQVNAHNAHRPYEDGYATNCVEAMIADERRHQGDPVEAKPTKPEDVATLGTLSRVREALGGLWTSHRDFDAVSTAMADTPVGSRGAVAFRHTDEEGRTLGHVVRIAHTEDGVVYADPQTGRLAVLPPDATDVRLLSADHVDETAHADVADDGGYGASPQERQEQRDAAVDEVADGLGITDPAQRQALADTYDVARDSTAPIVVDVAARMHDDLTALVAADPSHRVVFLGRDGHSLALASRALDPEFFDGHASEVVLSRAVVEAALRDVERNDPARDLSAIDDYRLRKKVAEEDVPGAFDRLTDYLDAAGVPVLREGGISLVDTSYKGTVQEMLTAAYPDPEFRGHYAFHGQSPGDPHPDAKKGYLVDLGPEDGGGRPLTELPGDPGRTFAHQDAIGVVEETLHGTMSSPRRIDEHGPVQQPQRFEPDPLSGLNPVVVAEPFTDPAVREGAKAVSLRAVVDVAEEAAARRAGGGPWREELAASAERGRDRVRSWVAGDPDTDPRLREVLDSLVRRGDKGAVTVVESAVRDLGPEERRRVWTEFAALPTIRERVEFAERLREGTP